MNEFDDVKTTFVNDGWGILQERCALPYVRQSDYGGTESEVAFIAKKAGKTVTVAVKLLAELSEYPSIIRGIITNLAQHKPSCGDIEVEVVFDEQQGHYALSRNGWVNGRRIHGAVIHIDIRGDKIWIQHDGTEYGVANYLVEAGVPKDHIVLAFKSPDMRKYTDFAVA